MAYKSTSTRTTRTQFLQICFFYSTFEKVRDMRGASARMAALMMALAAAEGFIFQAAVVPSVATSVRTAGLQNRFASLKMRMPGSTVTKTGVWMTPRMAQLRCRLL